MSEAVKKSKWRKWKREAQKKGREEVEEKEKGGDIEVMSFNILKTIPFSVTLLHVL